MEKKNKLFIALFICVFIIGLLTGAGGSYFITRSVGTISNLDRERHRLDAEYNERQRIIDENQQSAIELVDESIRYVENARAINQRTGANAGAAISDLRTASDFIRQGIKEKQDIENELNNLRATLYNLRDINRSMDR